MHTGDPCLEGVNDCEAQLGEALPTSQSKRWCGADGRARISWLDFGPQCARSGRYKLTADQPLDSRCMSHYLTCAARDDIQFASAPKLWFGCDIVLHNHVCWFRPDSRDVAKWFDCRSI